MTQILRRILFATLVCGLAGAGTIAGLSQGFGELTGEVIIEGETLVDPPAGQARDTHAYIALKGEGAAALYAAMQGRATKDLCRGAGWTMKEAGYLLCSFRASDGDAACELTIDLINGRLAAEGLPC